MVVKILSFNMEVKGSNLNTCNLNSLNYLAYGFNISNLGWVQAYKSRPKKVYVASRKHKFFNFEA